MAYYDTLSVAAETAEEQKGKETEAQRIERLRKEGILGAKDVATRSQAAADMLRQRQGETKESMTKAGKVGRAGMRRTVAQSMRARGPGPTSLASVANVAANLGQQLADAEATTAANIAGTMFQTEGKIGEAQVGAGEQKLKATEYEAEAGSKVADRNMKMKEYAQQISDIKKDHKSQIPGFPDDTTGAGDAIKALAAAEKNVDEVLYKYLANEAAKAYRGI
jgi:hypothetical protein